MNLSVLILTVGKMCLWAGLLVWVFFGWHTIGIPLVVVGVSSNIIHGILSRR